MAEEKKNEQTERWEQEVARDTQPELTPGQHLAVVRRVVLVLERYGLINREVEDFFEYLCGAAGELGVPFLELYLAVEADMGSPQVERENLEQWIAWCQEHAPERLTAKAAA
ncbi:MAG: hypothetical protein ABI629_07880 [bacterium]